MHNSADPYKQQTRFCQQKIGETQQMILHLTEENDDFNINYYIRAFFNSLSMCNTDEV